MFGNFFFSIFSTFSLQTCIVIFCFMLSNNVTEVMTVNVTIPTLIYIAILSAVLKHSLCEFTDCSLCLNRWLAHPIFLVMALTILFVFTIYKSTSNQSCTSSTFHDSKFIRFLILASAFHTFSLASSSFVEEEHQTWYFITHTFLIIISVMSLKKRQNDQWLLNAELLKNENRPSRTNVWSSCEKFCFEFIWLTLFGLLLVGRRLNQTGDKWLTVPDIGDFLVMEENRLWNSCFVVLCE